MDKIKKSRNLRKAIYIIGIIIFIALESKDIIEPKIYHAADNSYSLPIDLSVSTTISGTAASSATVYPGPITFTPFEEKN